MKTMPFHKYQAYPVEAFRQRTWPDRVITSAPVWCSVDLRDGNQALSQPMDIEAKMDMFRLLVDIGFKEIEVGFPSASSIEFAFVRRLIEGNMIPEDVTIQVLTPAREALVRQTFEAVRGAKNVIVHLYNSTSETQRRIVFGKDQAGITALAVDAARVMRELRTPGIRFEYSPESFHGTEPDFALRICEAVLDVWQPTSQDKVIINLPSTVEMVTPNVYADRIESFNRQVKGRENIIVSVHTHNDRGGAVASAELAVMAGAERVEGALFGNGERTGNMDIVTMAMNLFMQGVDPRLDLSDIDHVRRVYARCTHMEVHPRHPYAGDLVYTAFSGSHQDAINKGLKDRERVPNRPWEVPYLPIDPHDVGRNYEAVIRINSQSGKGGVAYVLEQEAGWIIPKAMQAEVGTQVQRLAEQVKRALTSSEIIACFRAAYMTGKGHCQLKTVQVHSDHDGAGGTAVTAVIIKEGREVEVRASGNGPVDAFVRGVSAVLGITVEVVTFAEHALSTGAAAEAVAYVGIRDDKGRVSCGAGIDANIATASIKAVVSALDRYYEKAWMDVEYTIAYPGTC